MTVAIMQPYFFPYIGYWQLIYAVDTFVIYDDVNYIKKGYINRNSMLYNNQTFRFTLELRGASQNKLINKIEVGNNKKKLLKTIEQAYKKAPQFNEVFPLIKSILENEEKNLGKFLGNSIEKISNYLEIDTKIIYSSNTEKDNSLRAEDKILEICQKLDASKYINAIGGQSLYNRENFSKIGIDLYFLETMEIKYNQFSNTFIPYLSIIDIMMFNTTNQIHTMLNNYRLIS